MLCIAAPTVTGTASAGDAEVPESQVESQGALDTRIAELIHQLGSLHYATRQRAKTELRRLRLDAFDALNAAQFNEDIEIALSARYLVRSMQVNWWTDEDPPEVKQLLREYGNRKEVERLNLMEQLAGLGRAMSFRPLSRLVRYEASERLSKKAALLTLALEPPTDLTERTRFAKELTAKAGKSQRTAACWLRAYAELLVDAPDTHQHWLELIAKEKARLADDPDESSKELTRNLLRWYADELAQRDRHDEALAMMRETIALLSTREPELLEAADWFRQRKSWGTIVELAERYRDTFARSAMLQYRLALAYRKLKQDDRAEATAKLALATVQDAPESHLVMAANLQHDGLFEWAEAEFRQVAGQIEEQPLEALRARIYLSEMMHDIGKEQSAGELLRQLIKLVESKEDIRKLVEEDLRRDMAGIKSRMHFFFAQNYGNLHQYEKQREWLMKGFQDDPHDADVLIAMHRVPESDASWQEATRKRIQNTVKHFRGQLKDFSDRLSSARPVEDRAMLQIQLALTYNQLAWLIANTEGDFDEALRCSLRSLELQPNRSGYLDTLGRCYYAKGDIENAIKYQTRAVTMEPHSPLIVAQLKLFQKTLQQKKAAAEQSPEKKAKMKADARAKETAAPAK